jgi:ATP-dependent exoDNAse (exonuclease V) alpha subunit
MDGDCLRLRDGFPRRVSPAGDDGVSRVPAKTASLSAIRNAAEIQGYTVRGFAPTSRATRQLNEAGVESETLQKFLARSSVSNAPDKRQFYFVDESSLASTNQMRDFLARLGKQDRVLLIGDTRQHQGVEAGRPFEQLQEAGMRTAKLDEIVRQKDPALKSAVEQLAKGDIYAALESLQRQDRVREIPDAQERIRAIAHAYTESPEKTLIVSPDNASRRALNVAVREELKAKAMLRRVRLLNDTIHRLTARRPEIKPIGW